MYNYYEAVKQDVRQWLDDNEYYISDRKEEGRDSFEEWLNDTLWIEDSVTGNGSGSYTFNTYEAGCNLAGNFDLLREALEEFGGSMDVLKDGEEACDVTIRCYLLNQAISDVLNDIWEEGEVKKMNIKEYKNNNITIKLDTIPENTSFDHLVCELSNELDMIDTYLVSEYPYCLGNDCIAVDFYNIRTNRLYTVNSYQINKYLLSGKTLRLYANTPDKWDQENINNYFMEDNK